MAAKREVPEPFGKEMAALYKMLAEALPLALQRLQFGGVTGLDQMAFWQAHSGLCEFIDLPLETDDVDDIASLHEAGDNLTDFEA